MSVLIRSRILATTTRLIEGTSTAQAGNLSYLYGPREEVARGRQMFFRALGTPLDHAVNFRAFNSDAIVDVDAGFSGLGMRGGLPLRADVLITRTPGVGLFVLLGDCQSLSLYDPVQEVIALVHASRQSTQLRLVTKVVRYLQQHYHCRPEDLLAYLGPSVAPEHYVFENWILQELVGWGKHVRSAGEGKYVVDLRGYNLEQLRLAGLRSKNIEDTGIDTYSSPEFYSHVRSVREGRSEQRFGVYLEMR